MADPEMEPLAADMEGAEDKAEPEKMSSKSDPVVDEVKKKLDEGAFMCCCCLCECIDKKTRDLSCCCIFPIRCGVYFIGAIILAVTLFVFLEIFYQLLNDDIHWWYVFVGVILASTLVVASAFVIVFFTKDQASSRVKLFTACMLVIIGVSLIAVWNACYYLFWYKKDSVVTGNDGVGFVKLTRKQNVVITLYVACLIDAIFAYFICVVNAYKNAYAEEEEDKDKEMEKPKMMEEAKAAEGAEEGKEAEAAADGEAAE